MSAYEEIMGIHKGLTERYHSQIKWTFTLEKIVDYVSISRIELLFMGMQITEKDRTKSLLYVVIGFTLMVAYPTLYNTCSYFRRRALKLLGREYVGLVKQIAGVTTTQIQDFENMIQKVTKNV